MFWSDRDNFQDILSLPIHSGQLGISGAIDLTPDFTSNWKSTLTRENFNIATVVCAYTGEAYTDLPTVERTVGFIPSATRDQREHRTKAASDFAASLGVPGIACHIGFIPHDRTQPDYQAVLNITRRICDHAARHGQTFALETGQEPAASLLNFIEDAARPT